MLVSEFIKRTGYRPECDAEYRGIEAQYMRESWSDKDDFCAHFKSHKSAVLKEAWRIMCYKFDEMRNDLSGTIRKLECENMHIKEDTQRLADYEMQKRDRMIAERDKTIEELKDRIEELARQRNAANEQRDMYYNSLVDEQNKVEALKVAIKTLKEG